MSTDADAAGGRYTADMDHKKKIVGAVVSALAVILYYLIYFCALIYVLDGALRYLLGIVPAVIIVLLVYVLVERIREIQGGEEDDLSQY